MPRNGISMTGRGSLPQPMIMESSSDARPFQQISVGGRGDAKQKVENLVLETVRQYFPETWLWNIYISK